MAVIEPLPKLMTTIQLLQIICIVAFGAIVGNHSLTLLFRLLSSTRDKKSTSYFAIWHGLHIRHGRTKGLLPDAEAGFAESPSRQPFLPERVYVQPLRATSTKSAPATPLNEEPLSHTRQHNADGQHQCLSERPGARQVLMALAKQYPETTYIVNSSSAKSSLTAASAYTPTCNAQEASADVALYAKQHQPNGHTIWLGKIAEVTSRGGLTVRLHRSDAVFVGESGWTNFDAKSNPDVRAHVLNLRWVFSWFIRTCCLSRREWITLQCPRTAWEIDVVEQIVCAGVGAAVAECGSESCRGTGSGPGKTWDRKCGWILGKRLRRAA